MLSRRTFGLSCMICLPASMLRESCAQSTAMFTVSIRADKSVRGLLPPIAQRTLIIKPDLSMTGRELAARAPPERGAPVILIIVGAIALVKIVEMIYELGHEAYYGGVVVDGRKSPPEISNDPKIPPNMVFVFQADGTVKQFKVGEVPTDLLTSVLATKK